MGKEIGLFLIGFLLFDTGVWFWDHLPGVLPSDPTWTGTQLFFGMQSWILIIFGIGICLGTVLWFLKKAGLVKKIRRNKMKQKFITFVSLTMIVPIDAEGPSEAENYVKDILNRTVKVDFTGPRSIDVYVHKAK